MRRDHLTMLTLSTALLGLTAAELALTYGHRLRRRVVHLALENSSRRPRAIAP